MGNRVKRLIERARAAWAAWKADPGERSAPSSTGPTPEAWEPERQERGARGAAGGGGAGPDRGAGQERGRKGRKAARSQKPHQADTPETPLGQAPARKPGSGHHDANRRNRAHLAELERVTAEVWDNIENPAYLPDIRDPKKKAYVLAFAQTGTKLRAAQVAGVHPSTPYTAQWRNDLVLQAAVEQAKEAAADLIEAEAYRRAVEGWEEPAGWYQGRPGGMVRRYSDVLAIFLLKGLRPEKYQERVQMRGALANLDLNQLPDELIERIARGENVLSVLASAVPRASEALPGLLGPPKQPE
jgi:hypothetical protein